MRESKMIGGLQRASHARSRRDFLELAGVTTAAGASVFIAACGGDEDEDRSPATRGDTARSRLDVRILNSALDLENTAIAAYRAGGPLLEGPALETAKRFLEQEVEHASGLRQALAKVGGTPSEPKSAEEYARSFPEMRNQTDMLRFAIDLERTAVAAYVDAVPKLSRGELRQTAAAIASNEAQHLSLLLGALGGEDPDRQVPDAFVVGHKG